MNNKEDPILANIKKITSNMELGDYQAQIVESLLDEADPTPEEIAKLNSIED